MFVCISRTNVCSWALPSSKTDILPVSTGAVFRVKRKEGACLHVVYRVTAVDVFAAPYGVESQSSNCSRCGNHYYPIVQFYNVEKASRRVATLMAAYLKLAVKGTEKDLYHSKTNGTRRPSYKISFHPSSTKKKRREKKTSVRSLTRPPTPMGDGGGSRAPPTNSSSSGPAVHAWPRSLLRRT